MGTFTNINPFAVVFSSTAGPRADAVANAFVAERLAGAAFTGGEPVVPESSIFAAAPSGGSPLQPELGGGEAIHRAARKHAAQPPELRAAPLSYDEWTTVITQRGEKAEYSDIGATQAFWRLLHLSLIHI